MGGGCYFGAGGVSRQGQHPLFAAFPGRAAKERKRGIEIPEWRDSSYVISGAAPSRPREAGSGGEAAAGAATQPSAWKPVSGHSGESQAPRQLGWGGKTAPKISQGALTSLLCPLTNGGGLAVSGRKGCWEV